MVLLQAAAQILKEWRSSSLLSRLRRLARMLQLPTEFGAHSEKAARAWNSAASGCDLPDSQEQTCAASHSG
jgi:hypothetical protein